MNQLLKKITAWFPIVMSIAALGILVGHFIIFGQTQQEDEGTAARLFQVLMGGQLSIIAFFLVKYLPKKPKQALQVLALQSLVAFIPLALLFVFEYQAIPQPHLNASTDLDSIFEVDKKELGTQLFYSENLGVGFTYLPYPGFEVIVTESDNKIALSEQSIEVFTKDPQLTLAQAIETEFLQGYSPSDCFVVIYEPNQLKISNYISAGISYPKDDDPNTPWWQNGEKCPAYSETNGIQFFVMNPDVPGKFLFISLGQAGVAFDGTPYTEAGGQDWSHSIRILK